LTCFYCNAQADLQNNGVLFLSSAQDTLYLNGSFVNNSSAGFTNNGNFYLKQHLTNNQPALSAGNGTLYLSGSSTQTISGTQVFKTHHLVTNNNVGITLNNNLSVDGLHTFLNGIVTASSSPNYLVYEEGSSYIGSTDNRHVNGWVKKIGNTDFVFPVGNGVYVRPVALTGFSVTSEFNVKYFATTPFTSQLQPPLVSIDLNEYWTINKVAGGTASVTMNWDNNKVAIPNWTISEITSAGINGTKWTDQGGIATGNIMATGSITSNMISSFDKFTFASKSYPVPLTLISFTGRLAGYYAKLEWTTANEQNVDHFTLERSDDGSHFHAINSTPARNSGATEHYIYLDDTPLGGKVYYRLRSVDMDASEKLSKLVMLRNDSGSGALTLLTNPVHGQLVLETNDRTEGLFFYTIIAMSGQPVQQGQLEISNSAPKEILMNKNLISGTYVLEVKNKVQSYRFIFIKQ
jgi:hypothetical protein